MGLKSLFLVIDLVEHSVGVLDKLQLTSLNQNVEATGVLVVNVGRVTQIGYVTAAVSGSDQRRLLELRILRHPYVLHLIGQLA